MITGVWAYFPKTSGMDQKTIHNHLGKMATLPNFLNSDLSLGFTVESVAEKHGWTDPMVWSLALEGKNDTARFKELSALSRKFGDVFLFLCCNFLFVIEFAQNFFHVLSSKSHLLTAV